MLNQTADHALRALLAIARHGGERPLRVEEVAGLTGAPRNYLGKTLGGLVKAGLLQSSRGPLGGFSLAVYLFLYAPILVLAALSFNASRVSASFALMPSTFTK